MTLQERAARRLAVLAVRDEDDPVFSEGIDEQVRSIRDWLLSPTLGERALVEDSLDLRNLTQEELDVARHTIKIAEDEDAVALYITGHGSAGEGRSRHFLHLPGTDPHDLARTAYPTADLVEAVLSSRAEHVLVVVDSCHAGALFDEINSRLKDFRRADYEQRRLAVITSADFDQKPFVGQFTRALASALQLFTERKESTPQAYLSPHQLSELLQRVRREDPTLPRPLWPGRWDPSIEAHHCLPNPGYVPPQPVVDAAVQQIAPDRTTLRTYWLGKGSGRTSDADAGWYFTGRRDLMRDLVDFVSTGSGLLTVTGVAGSGKSAMLARVVLLSDRNFTADYPAIVREVPTELRPSVGAIDAAMLARDKTSNALVADLVLALGGSVDDENSDRRPSERVRAQVRERLDRGVSTTVIIDGLDEAATPLAIVTDVIAPLLRARTGDSQPDLRVVVGLRSPRPASAEGGGPENEGMLDLLNRLAETDRPALRTDGESTAAEVAEYVRLLLLAPGQGANSESPYSEHPEEAERMGSAIAARVSPSFLEARHAAERLRRASQVQDVNDAAWLVTLADGVSGLFRQDLHDVAERSGRPTADLLAVLRASALAFGAGIPWSAIWPAATLAVLGREGERDVDDLIATVLDSSLAGYLTRDIEDERYVYRASHERIRELLRDAPARLLDVSESGGGS